MIRRSLLTAALILVGSAAIAPKTMAQTAPNTVDIPFTGNVGNVCTFIDPTPGILGVDSPTSPTAFSAKFQGGTMGKVSVSCNSTTALAVSPPAQTGGPTFTPTSSEGIVYSPNGVTSSNGAPLNISATDIPTPLNVDARVLKGSLLAPGTYNYKVTLTVVQP